MAVVPKLARVGRHALSNGPYRAAVVYRVPVAPGGVQRFVSSKLLRRDARALTRARSFCDAQEKSQELWDITADGKIKFNFKEEDIARFQSELPKFRADPRLQLGSLQAADGAEDLDHLQTLKALVSVLRINEYVTEPLRDMCIERLTENAALVEHFGIPVLEDFDGEKPLHNKAVPGAGVYLRVRMQAYWFALHIWLLHSKQFLVQANEGLFGSAICALITRRLFEWTWIQLRGWMHDADVPVMSITSEVQDLQEFIFGLCVALDDAFREEAPDGTLAAVALEDAAVLDAGRYGLGPRVKYVLWANVYSGMEPHDSDQLYELTVYLLRQRAFLETVPRGAFFTDRKSVV